ncbi:MAG: lipid kinase [Phormidesmis sp.]
MKRRALLLINPLSRSGQTVGVKAAQRLRDQDLDVIEAPIDELPLLSKTICQYRDRVDFVIIGGGDGTLRFAIDGLLSTGLPLGILPLGTANNLARSLGIPTRLSQACLTIATGTSRSIDLGIVNGHYFFNVAGIGLSAEINRRVSRVAKHRWGALAYIATAIQVFRQAKSLDATIRYCSLTDAQTFNLKAKQITICNGRYYGSGLIVADDAAIDDARLDLYGFDIQHWRQVVRLLPELRWGHHSTLPNVLYLAGTRFTIETNTSRPVDVDGEILTMTPATFEVRPKALHVLVPRSGGRMPILQSS